MRIKSCKLVTLTNSRENFTSKVQVLFTFTFQDDYSVMRDDNDDDKED